MEPSILISVKKNLGLEVDYTVFDGELVTYINTAFSTLNDLGIGPATGFSIEDTSATWAQFLPNVNHKMILSNVKTYVYLKVRMLFDPPTTSYTIASFNEQLRELESRIYIQRETTEWADPLPLASSVIPTILDGGDA